MMPSSKKMMREFSLIRFYCILTLSLMYFVVQLGFAHWTHSLILQVDAYHMLYNILSLITCILTIQMSRTSGAKSGKTMEVSESTTTGTAEAIIAEKMKLSSLKNTFGWTRIDVCGAVANLCFLSALCFSVVVEALQTIFHASHHGSMHHPLAVAIVGVIGLGVNSICFLTIGGYTFHQSSFLSSNHEVGVGDDVIISASVQSYVQQGIKNRRRQGFIETIRDIFGTILVIVCASVIQVLRPQPGPGEVPVVGEHRETMTVDYLDPAFCIITVIILALLSYSYAREAGHILLLTIPDHIHVETLLEEMQQSFPEIYDIHDFHVWQLTPARIIASAHIVLDHTQGYLAIQNNVVDFLNTKGISHVTLQPEFLQIDNLEQSPNLRRRKCFLPCGDQEDCRLQQCCASATLTPCNSTTPIDNASGHHHHHHHDAKPRYTEGKSTEIDMNDLAANPELEPMI